MTIPALSRTAGGARPEAVAADIHGAPANRAAAIAVGTVAYCRNLNAPAFVASGCFGDKAPGLHRGEIEAGT